MEYAPPVLTDDLLVMWDDPVIDYLFIDPDMWELWDFWATHMQPIEDEL